MQTFGGRIEYFFGGMMAHNIEIKQTRYLHDGHTPSGQPHD